MRSYLANDRACRANLYCILTMMEIGRDIWVFWSKWIENDARVFSLGAFCCALYGDKVAAGSLGDRDQALEFVSHLIDFFNDISPWVISFHLRFLYKYPLGGPCIFAR